MVYWPNAVQSLMLCSTPTLVSHEVCKIPDEFSNEKLAAVFIKCGKVIGMELKLIVLSEHHCRILMRNEGERFD